MVRAGAGICFIRVPLARRSKMFAPNRAPSFNQSDPWPYGSFKLSSLGRSIALGSPFHNSTRNFKERI